MKSLNRSFSLAILCSVALAAQAQDIGKLKTTTDTIVTSTNINLGSVDKVTEDRMNKGLVTNSLNALSGQAAGVSVSSGENRMAMLSSVRVRGTTSLTGGNDPLVIIDGVSADLATLSSIYPADIESFTILKNAAETAMYGSRGASGVIEVTTKKGKGGQFHISYDGSLGAESVYKNLKMLRRNDYLNTAGQLGLYCYDGGHDTDFPNAITRTGFVQNHHLSFSGGSEQSNYRASIGMMDHNTIIKVSSYNNFVAKLDLTQKAFDDRLIVDMGVFGSSQKNKYIFDEQELFYSAAAQNPTFPNGMNADGGWDKNTTASQINNPLALLYSKDHARNLNFNTHLKLTHNIWPNLQFIVFGSYSFTSNENAQFVPTWVWGHAYRGERKTEDWLGNATVNYWWDFNSDHRIEIVGLAEYQSSTRRGFYTTVNGFNTNGFGYDNLQAGSQRPYDGTGSNYDRPALASFMGRAKYMFYGKYEINVNARADGSSMVGKHHRWGFFPSISAEWDVKAEDYMRQFDNISLLKVRTGYGISGNLGGIDSYNSLQRFMPVGIVPNNGMPTVTLGYASNVNPDLKWETRSTFNLGLDLGMLKNRLVFTAEYYYSKTHDMLYLYDVSVPPFAYSKMLANLGAMSNSGLELGFGITPIETQDMQLNVNMNLSYQHNKLISLSGNYKGQYMGADEVTSIGSLNGAGFHGGNNDIVYQIVGQPLGVFYLPHCTGLSQDEKGHYRYDIADLDGDGIVNMADDGDRYIAGQATPKWTLGSNISFRYKDFDFSLQMNGAFGHKIYNGTALTYMNMTSFPDYNVMHDAPERAIYDQNATDYWLESGDYLNFDYLTVGWNVPISHYAPSIHSLRVALSVNNLGTITSYSGLTPMINSYVVSKTLGIDDKRNYPPYRSYSIAVSISF